MIDGSNGESVVGPAKCLQVVRTAPNWSSQSACGGSSVENNCLEFELVDWRANMSQDY